MLVVEQVNPILLDIGGIGLTGVLIFLQIKINLGGGVPVALWAKLSLRFASRRGESAAVSRLRELSTNPRAQRLAALCAASAGA